MLRQYDSNLLYNGVCYFEMITKTKLCVGFVVLLVKPTSEMEMKRIAVAERRSVLVCF